MSASKSTKEVPLSEIAQVIFIILAIDCVIAIGVGGVVFLNAEDFWEKARDHPHRFLYLYSWQRVQYSCFVCFSL